MATVMHARDPRFKRDVALKLLPRPFIGEPEFRARFQREAFTIAALEHDAIVPVYDSGEQSGQPYLVMRYMAGGSLAQRIDRGPLAMEEAAGVLLRIASALGHAHARGVIHRDLKPGNVLFDPTGLAYLSDFGIAQLSEATISLTVSGAIIGTPAYMSPEQVQGDVELDARSDIYALGVILFEMLTGRQPYRANTPTKVMMKHVLEPVPHIREVDPELPAAADDIVARAMAKERSRRYPTASQLAESFQSLLTDTPRPLTMPAVHRPPGPKPPQSTTLTSGSRAEGIRGLKRLPAWGWIAGSIVGLAGVVTLVGGSAFASRSLNKATPTAVSSPAEIARVTPQPSPKLSATGTSSPTPTGTTTALPQGPVSLTVQTDAVCRIGPGVNFDVVGYLTSGETALAHGRDQSGSWWWIEFPTGDRFCWISGLLVGLNGAGGALPVLTSGPTSTPGSTATSVPPENPKPKENTSTPGATKAKTLPPDPDSTPIKWLTLIP